MNRPRGFTLVEILIGLVILGFVIMTSLGIFFDRQKRLQAAHDVVVAYQALSNEAEVRRYVPYPALILGSEEPFLSSAELLDQLADSEATVEIEQERAGLKTVVMTIQWSKRKQHVTMSILRTDTGAGGGLW